MRQFVYSVPSCMSCVWRVTQRWARCVVTFYKEHRVLRGVELQAGILLPNQSCKIASKSRHWRSHWAIRQFVYQVAWAAFEELLRNTKCWRVYPCSKPRNVEASYQYFELFIQGYNRRVASWYTSARSGCKMATEFFAFAIPLSIAAISTPSCMSCFSGTSATSPLAKCLDWKFVCFNAMHQSSIGAIHVRVWCFTVMSQSTAGVSLQLSVWDQFIVPVASWFRFTRIACSSGVFQMFCKCPGWSFDVAVHRARCFASICADY